MTAAEVNVRVVVCWCGKTVLAVMVTERKLAGFRCSALVRTGSQVA